MAFCTTCGAVMNPNGRYCPTCGAEAPAKAQAAAATPQGAPASAPVPPPATSSANPPFTSPVPTSTGSGSILRLVLVVVAVIVALGIISLGILTYGAYKLKQSVRGGSGASVRLPGISVNGNGGASPDILRELGVEPYPNARMLPGAGVVHLGQGVAGGAEFETSDTPAQVASFYRFRYPHSTLSSDEENTSTLVIDQGSRGILAMAMKRDGERTHVSVSRIGSPSR